MGCTAPGLVSAEIPLESIRILEKLKRDPPLRPDVVSRVAEANENKTKTERDPQLPPPFFFLFLIAKYAFVTMESDASSPRESAGRPGSF